MWTRILSVGLVGFFLTGCNQNFRGPEEVRAARARAQAQGQPLPASAAPDGGSHATTLDGSSPPVAPGLGPAATESGPSIAGTISLAPELAGKVHPAGVIYVIARNGPGPPLAVARLQVESLPVRYRLSADNVMMPGAAFEGSMTVSARLDADGAVGQPQPGDVDGSSIEVSVGAQNADIVLSQLH
jgi:hypothetical protein